MPSLLRRGSPKLIGSNRKRPHLLRAFSSYRENLISLAIVRSPLNGDASRQIRRIFHSTTRRRIQRIFEIEI